MDPWIHEETMCYPKMLAVERTDRLREEREMGQEKRVTREEFEEALGKLADRSTGIGGPFTAAKACRCAALIRTYVDQLSRPQWGEGFEPWKCVSCKQQFILDEVFVDRWLDQGRTTKCPYCCCATVQRLPMPPNPEV